MTDRKRTKSEERSYSELLGDLIELEAWSRQDKLKRATIPPEWHRIEREVPVRPKKVPVSLQLDADVARWFRALGQGHQARMNAVLRAYMLAVVSREIESARDLDWKGDPI